MANIFINIKAITAGAIASLQQLSGSMNGIAKSSKGVAQAQNLAGARANGFANRLSNATKAIANFNRVSRVGASGARDIGTSMIFAGGAFRDLGVGINVASSLFQTFTPIIGAFTSALGPAGLLLVPLVSGLFSTATSGIKFNSVMETTQISIATLITQFKDLYTTSGEQIGAFKEMTDAQIKGLSTQQLDNYQKEQAISVNAKLTAALSNAREAFSTLTAEAAQSPFTTQDLAKSFQAVVGTLGQYNVTSKQAAGLTVTLARVASVAGISAGNLASQFTLFLAGAGRITSPLSRFASQVGLTKDKIKELRAEFEAARDSPEKTAAIMAVLTTRLAAFDIAGRLVATSWQGIMSNMEEAFDLFAGTVTTGLFETVRDAFLGVVPVVDAAGQQMFEVFDASGKKLASEFDKNGDKIVGSVKRVKTQTTGILTKIFDLDETGQFVTKGGDLAKLFTAPLQKAIESIRSLFDLIGEDIADALSNIGDFIQKIAGFIGDNQDGVLDIYEKVVLIVEQIARIMVDLLSLVGISSDLNSTLENTTSNLDTILSTVIFIRGSFLFIVVIVTSLIALFGTAAISIATLISLVVTGLYDAFVSVYNVVAEFGNAVRTISNYIDGLSGKEIQFTAKFEPIENDLNESVKGILERAESGINVLGKEADSSIKAFVGGAAENKANAEERIVAKEKKIADDKETILKIRTRFGKQDLKSGDKEFVSDAEALRINRDEVRRAKLAPSALERPKKNVNPEDGDGKKKKGARTPKTPKEAIELSESAFKELNAVYATNLDFIAALVERTYSLIQSKLEDAQQSLQDMFARGEISIIDLNEKTVTLVVAGIRAQIKEIDELERIRLENHEIEIDNIEKSSQQETFKYKNSLRAAETNNKSEIFKQNLLTKHVTEQKKFAFQLTEQESKNDAQRVKNLANREKKELEVIKTIKAANQELFLELRKIGDGAVSTLADLEDKRGGSTKAREFQLDTEARDKIKAIELDSEAIGKRLTKALQEQAELVNNRKEGDEEILEINSALVQLTEDQKAAAFVLLDIAKAELRVAEAQLQITSKKYSFDKSTDDISRLRERGLISERQAIEEAADAAEEYQKNTRQYYQTLLDLAAFLEAKGGIKNILQAQELRKVAADQLRANEVIDSAAVAMRENARNAFGTFFEDIQNDITSIGDAFVKLGQSIAQTFQKLIAQRLSEQLFDSLFGNARSGKKGVFGDVFGQISQSTGLGNKPRTSPDYDDPDGDANKVDIDTKKQYEEGKLGTNILTNSEKLLLKTDEVIKDADKAITATGETLAAIKIKFKELLDRLDTSTKRISELESQVEISDEDSVPDDYNSGSYKTTRKKILPKKMSEEQFRAFFTGLGVKDINRVRGRAVNAGSLHPRGGAIDPNFVGLKTPLTNKITATAILSGQRFVDERVKQKNIKGSGVHFEKEGRLRASIFANAKPSLYGGKEGLEFLKLADALRLGKNINIPRFLELAQKLDIEIPKSAGITEIEKTTKTDVAKPTKPDVGVKNTGVAAANANDPTAEKTIAKQEVKADTVNITANKADIKAAESISEDDKKLDVGTTSDKVTDANTTAITNPLGTLEGRAITDSLNPVTAAPSATGEVIPVFVTNQGVTAPLSVDPLAVKPQGDSLENQTLGIDAAGNNKIETVLQNISNLLVTIDSALTNINTVVFDALFTDAIKNKIPAIQLALDLSLSAFATRMEEVITAASDAISEAISSAGAGGGGGDEDSEGSGGFFGKILSKFGSKNADGGHIRGAGGSRDDKIPAWLSNGEYVIQAAAVKTLGLQRLDALNNAHKGAVKFALGGLNKFKYSYNEDEEFNKPASGRLVKFKNPKDDETTKPFLDRFNKFKYPNDETPKPLLDRYNKRRFVTSNSTHKGAPKFGFGGLTKYIGLFSKLFKGKKSVGDGGSRPRVVTGTNKGFFGFFKNLFKTDAKDGSGISQGSKNLGALKGGLIQAGISIGLALLGRLFAKKQPKSDPDRVKDPYGLNPDTKTFYNKPIISGVRNYLRDGGLVTSSKQLMGNSPTFAQGGLANMDNLSGILSDLQGGDNNNSTNIKQNVTINTPDVHSFRNNRAAIERDMSRMTQRGARRRPPKY